jgi:hypothetical protein
MHTLGPFWPIRGLTTKHIYFNVGSSRDQEWLLLNGCYRTRAKGRHASQLLFTIMVQPLRKSGGDLRMRGEKVFERPFLLVVM